MYILSSVARQQFFTDAGAIVASGFLYTYQAGTSTPLAVFSDSSGTAHANPVALDAAGRAAIYLDSTLAYKYILKDSGLNTIWTQDNIRVAGVTETGTQTLSNKTLDNTSTIDIKSSQLSIENPNDEDFYMQFVATGLTAARTITLPDGSGTLLLSAVENTLTKRLQLREGTDVDATAGVVTLPTDGNHLGCTSDASLFLKWITNTSIQDGTTITLHFEEAMVVHDQEGSDPATGYSLKLHGQMDWNVGIGDTLTLTLKDGYWEETARSVMSTQQEGAFITVTTALTDAQIKALPTTPIQLSRTCPANSVLEFIDAHVKIVLVAVYTNVDGGATMFVQTSEDDKTSESVDDSFFNVGAGTFRSFIFPSMTGTAGVIASADLIEAELELKVANAAAGDFTGGDSGNSMTVIATYKIIKVA